MTFRSMLIHVNAAEYAAPLLDAAAALAGRCRSQAAGSPATADDGNGGHSTRQPHFTGLNVIPMPPVYSMAEALNDPEVLDYQRKRLREIAEAAKAAFGEAGEARSLSTSWRTEEVFDSETDPKIAKVGRSFDIVVLTRAQDLTAGAPYHNVPERVMLAAGRPVLLVPPENKVEHIGRHVLVAWNGSRESARAAADALPLLKCADKVTLFEAVAGEAGNEEEAPSRLALRDTLKRHGIDLQFEISEASGADTGTEILETANRLSADTLVMGGYGHSRLSEVIFGGATRHILRSANIPVLVSH